MVPPDQGFHGHDPVVVDRGDGLVVDGQLVVVDRVTEVIVDLEPGHRLGPQRLVEDLDPAPTLVLGLEHGRIGLLQDVLGRLAPPHYERHADAGGHHHVAPGGELDRIGQQPRVLVGQADGHVDVVDIAAQHDELVSGEPADHVPAPHRRLEALGQGQQDLVAAHMAEGVVDQLEVVQVDEEDGQVGAPLHGNQQLALELVVEQRAVAQAGEGVVVGQPVQLGFGRLAIGDVGERADHHGYVVAARSPTAAAS